MSDLLGSLKGKLEIMWRRRFPRINRLRRRHTVKRVVDLNAVQPAGIVSEELLIRQPLGIEQRPPFFVAETGRAKPNARHSRIMAQMVLKTPVNIGLEVGQYCAEA